MRAPQDTPGDQGLQESLAERFPDYCIWRSRRGDRPNGWCATRYRPLTDEELRGGLARTLMAGNPRCLRVQLEEQTGDGS